LIDSQVLRPLFDDVNTRRMDVDGVEISAIGLKNRAQLTRIVEECSRILGMPAPRVYVASGPGLNAYTTNIDDPIIVLHASVLRRYQDPAELRFLVGHEMGHIRCHHVKLLMVLRAMSAAMPSGVNHLTFLPLLKWAREAEMSADNAGLICCQDLAVAEMALIRLVIDLDDRTLEKVDVDAYLAQRERDVSSFAEAVYFWRQVTSDHPFIPDRVDQLREYEKSKSYGHLWQ
jgi:Zn-dependent protease with chaperone function